MPGPAVPTAVGGRTISDRPGATPACRKLLHLPDNKGGGPLVLIEPNKDLAELLSWIEGLGGDITAHRTFPERPARYGERPPLDHRLGEALRRRGIERLYTHQTEAIGHIRDGRHVVVVTPTASGKTACYNLPVLDSILKGDAARALYLFPTKALSQDQLTELYGLVEALEVDIGTFTYDGDTPPAARRTIRKAGHIVITNPDMLHTGILPHHTKWIKLFENLRYIVIDELHTYRGVFGSHLANVLRRLQRVCAFYGSEPQFICCSATISNPGELAERLVEKPFRLVTQNGAPAGEKRVVFYNPPVVNRQLGIRQSSLKVAARIATETLANGISTIVFTRSRINVELLLTYIRKGLARRGASTDIVGSYRGGYLPDERRRLERRLKSGELLGVVSTSALELGVDIGSLQLAVLHGYPGSVASAWQQMGRAGRRSGVSAAVMVASSLALDQFLTARPENLFGASPEHARLDADNLYILVNHVKCSAFELPFREGESLGSADMEEILQYLAEQGTLHRAGGRYHWQSDSFPAESISLRSATSENYVILDITETGNPVVIGEVDRPSAPMLIHPEAIYFHGGKAYQVTELDPEGMRCYVRKADVDYYTDADLAVRMEVLDEFERQGLWSWGEVLVAARPTVYKKIRLHTHENIGYGNIHLGEEQMHTTGAWFGIEERWIEGLDRDTASSALSGLANLFRNVAPLYLMCDHHDLIVHGHVRDPYLGQPAVYMADNVPGGVGLAETAFSLRDRLAAACREALESCGCREGCPGCIGVFDASERIKEASRWLLLALERGMGSRPETAAGGDTPL
ncbi:MAG: DEAD/DEAH box helicase [Synergistales bacterium]|nr:DEAD/DEAH box helicase [Synergistales bacterium]